MRRQRSVEQYILVGTIFALFIFVALPLLKPVILGLLLGVVCFPLAGRIAEAGRFRPSWAAGLTTLLFAIGVPLPLGYIVAVVARDSVTLAGRLSSLASNWGGESGGSGGFSPQELLQFLHSRVANFIPFPLEDFENAIRNGLATVGTFSAGLLAGFATSIPAAILGIVVFLLTLYFALVDGRRLVDFLREVIPFRQSETELFFRTTVSICRGVVLGSVLTGLVQGSIIGLAYWFLGLPRALFMGTMTAILSFIPFLGSWPAGLGGMIYLFVVGRQGAAIGMLVAFGLASVSDNVVKTLALRGGEGDLHPLLGFISVLGGLAVFGFAGLFIGPLVTALSIAALGILAKNPPV